MKKTKSMREMVAATIHSQRKIVSGPGEGPHELLQELNKTLERRSLVHKGGDWNKKFEIIETKQKKSHRFGG